MEVEKKLIQITPKKTTTIRFVLPSSLDKEVGILVLPALGVKAKYYEPLLKELAVQGYPSAVVDLQGQGESSVIAGRTIDFGYKEILEEDIPIAITTAKEIFSLPLVILGHSLGGQMASLYLGSSDEKILGLILCASCSVYYKGWEGYFKWRALLGTQFCMLLSKAFGYFPGNRVGFGGVTGKKLIHDWAYQARTGKYRVANSTVEWEKNLKKVKIPILAISIKKDFLAPDKAVTHLCQKMPSTEITRFCLDLPTLNHFTWVKEPIYFLKVIIPWINQTIKKEKS